MSEFQAYMAARQRLREQEAKEDIEIDQRNKARIDQLWAQLNERIKQMIEQGAGTEERRAEREVYEARINAERERQRAEADQIYAQRQAEWERLRAGWTQRVEAMQELDNRSPEEIERDQIEHELKQQVIADYRNKHNLGPDDKLDESARNYTHYDFRRRRFNLREGMKPSKAFWPRPPQLEDSEGVEPDADSAEETDSAEQSKQLSALMCHDSVFLTEDEPQRLSDWVSSDPTENIFLVLPPKPNSGRRFGNEAICYSRSALRSFLDDPASRFFPCTNTGGSDNTFEFIKIPLGDWSAFVPRRDVIYAVRYLDVTLFQIRSTDVVVEKTASYNNAVVGEFISADHCQPGSDKTIYTLRGIRLRK